MDFHHSPAASDDGEAVLFGQWAVGGGSCSVADMLQQEVDENMENEHHAMLPIDLNHKQLMVALSKDFDLSHRR